MKLLVKKPLMHYLIALCSLWLLPTVVIADETLWKSGKNLYIKLADQDNYSDGKRVPNQHPVTLNPTEINNALNLIRVWDKDSKKRDAVKSVFTKQQILLLGKYLANGLAQAKPGEDIVFALSSKKVSAIVFKELYYMAGRAFYSNDRLHIIIGDYDRLPDKFQERAERSHGNISGVQYFFNKGKRSKPSKFKRRLIAKEGIENYTDGSEHRPDWFVIDVRRASQTFVAENERNKKSTATFDDTAIRLEAARLAKERREMRAEMARMRKEMKESGGSKEQLTVEQRLVKLNELHEKNLITDSEYDQKRRDILNDI